MKIRPLPAGYQAASNGGAFILQDNRRILRVTGRSPGEMLNAILTNTPPGPLSGEGAWLCGETVYAALLTNKGKIVTDLRVFRDQEDVFILDLPEAGAAGALSHFKTYLPPRLARVEEDSADLAILTLMGPRVRPLLEGVEPEFGLPGTLPPLEELQEGSEWVAGAPEAGTFRVVGNGSLRVAAWDILLPRDRAVSLSSFLRSSGVEEASQDTLDLLRLEKGRPYFGRDMDESIILPEAGIGPLAVDDAKGCYTGQEVVIRVRDRGRVNKLLRGLLLGQVPAPEGGEELFQAEGEKSVGWITSAAPSPHFGETIALGYVRRAVGPGAVVRVGSPDGSEARIRGLGPQGWVLD